MAKTFVEHLEEKQPRKFEARPIYSADGDFISVYLADEDSYAERVDELLTVYRSTKNDTVIGCKITGVRRLLKTLGEFGFSIDGPDVSISLFFVAGALSSPDKRERYAQVGRQTPHLKIRSKELDLQPA